MIDKQQIDVPQFPKDALHTYAIPTGWNFRAHKDSAPFAEGCLLHGPQPLWLPAGCPGHWSVKYVAVSGEFKQTAGVQSRLRKVFSSFGAETDSLLSLEDYLWKGLDKKLRTEGLQVWEKAWL